MRFPIPESVLVVSNDENYGIIRHRQDLDFDRAIAAEYEGADFAAIAVDSARRASPSATSTRLRTISMTRTGRWSWTCARISPFPDPGSRRTEYSTDLTTRP